MDTNQKFVITIARQLGSGGRTIGRKLARKLDVRYSDKELLRALRKKFDLTTDSIEKLKSQKKSWLADFMHMVAPVPKAEMINNSGDIHSDVTTNDVFKAEKEILLEIAEESSCVIAGRSGFFVLKDHPNKLDIFITASLENRIKRVMFRQQLSRTEAETLIESVDKARDNYIMRFTGASRYDARNYDLAINSDNHTEDQIVDLILSYIGK